MDGITIRYSASSLHLQGGQETIIGRAQTNFDIQDPRVSREQLKISWNEDGWLLENIGKAGAFINGQPVTRQLLNMVCDVQLAGADGPVIRFEPEGRSSALPPPPSSAPAMAGSTQGGLSTLPPPPQGVYPGQYQPAIFQASDEKLNVKQILDIFFPFKDWLKEKKLWGLTRILVAIYALAPIAFLAVFLANSGATINQFGWAFALYFAPLWIIIFWYLIGPGKLDKTGYAYCLIAVVSEIILWGAGSTSIVAHIENATGIKTLKNPIADLLKPGIIEEGTKLLPVLILALLNIKNKNFTPKFWMFLGAVAGVTAGSMEAREYILSSINILQTNQGNVALVDITGVFTDIFRSLDDAFSHAIWVAISSAFVGFAVSYPRRKVQLILGGFAVPVVLHALNDWFTSFGSTAGNYLWFLVQAFSTFLFLGYTISLSSIEKSVRHTKAFRGQSMYMDDPSSLEP
jgi:RsiW-degrading membrane proteinase PrsW (M82 family)